MDTEVLLEMLDELIETVREAKPGDKSELDRKYAVVLTEMEKVRAIFQVFIVEASK